MSPSFFRFLSGAVLQANGDRRLIGRALVRFGGLISPELQIESLLAILYLTTTVWEIAEVFVGEKALQTWRTLKLISTCPIFSPIYWLSLQRPSAHTTPVRTTVSTGLCGAHLGRVE